MNRLRVLVLVCLCVLIPGVARADNGGWLDWLYSLDAKMWGIGTEFHICLDKSNKIVNCEELFGIPALFGAPIKSATAADIQHELDLRVAYYHNYGDRFGDDNTGSDRDLGTINGWRLMPLYHYHVTPQIAIGFGAGFMVFYGKGRNGTDGFDTFSRGIITPISVIVAPFLNGPKKGFFVRVESVYTTTGFTGADFGNTKTAFSSNGGEWSFSIATGYDFRRLR